ncbi:MAG: hypothetical protein ABIH21_00745 [Patescibacteria group bacterium]
MYFYNIVFLFYCTLKDNANKHFSKIRAALFAAKEERMSCCGLAVISVSCLKCFQKGRDCLCELIFSEIAPKREALAPDVIKQVKHLLSIELSAVERSLNDFSFE